MAVQRAYIQLSGGEDLVTPVDEVPPGSLSLGKNVYPNYNLGYTRFAGFERFDGRTAPSSQDTPAEQETARALIQAVPGAGDVTGVWIYDGDVYAFRNTATTGAKMYKSTASGWSEVVPATTNLTVQDGRFEFVNYNFGGHSSTEMMYGCDGKNKAWEWDGTTFTPITTGMTTDAPTHITAHKKYLWLSFLGGSVQHSPLADPTGTWVLDIGTSELAIGEEITALQPITFDTMAIFGANRTTVLYGTPAVDLNLTEFNDKVGARQWTMQRLGQIYYMDNLSITEFSRSDQFGDFIGNSISKLIQPYVDELRANVTASAVDRKRGLYYLFTNTGEGLIGAFFQDQLLGFCRLQLGINITCACSGQINGEERVFVGADDGFIYELQKGTTFDGNDVRWALSLPYHHYGTPRAVKRFRKVVVTLGGPSRTNATLRLKPDWGFGSTERYDVDPIEETTDIGGAYWDFGWKWDDGTRWGERVDDNIEFPIYGQGTHMSLIMSSEQSYEEQFTIKSVKVHYSPRKVKRTEF